MKTHQRSTFPPNVNYDVLEGSRNSVSAMAVLKTGYDHLSSVILKTNILDRFTGQVSINISRCKWQLMIKAIM